MRNNYCLCDAQTNKIVSVHPSNATAQVAKRAHDKAMFRAGATDSQVVVRRLGVTGQPMVWPVKHIP